METRQWWELVDVIERGALFLDTYRIRCKHCHCEYEIATLLGLPDECPDCDSKGELNANS